MSVICFGAAGKYGREQRASNHHLLSFFKSNCEINGCQDQNYTPYTILLDDTNLSQSCPYTSQIGWVEEVVDAFLQCQPDVLFSNWLKCWQNTVNILLCLTCTWQVVVKTCEWMWTNSEKIWEKLSWLSS